METFEPLINLLVLMGVLSMVAERVANAIKLGRPDLRHRKHTAWEEKERERRIARVAVVASILLAVVVKADFFEILAHLEAPWDTLGWFRATEAKRSVARLAYTLCGTVVTGFSLGFGSKFWHDVLDTVHGLRHMVSAGSRAESIILRRPPPTSTDLHREGLSL